MMKTLMLAVLTALAVVFCSSAGASGGLCAHASATTQSGLVATAHVSVVSVPCVVSVQAIDKSGTGHGVVTGKTTVVFTAAGPGSLQVSGPCGVNWETDVVLGAGGSLYGDDPDLHAQSMTRVPCVVTPPPVVVPPVVPPVVAPPPNTTRGVYCSALTGASLNLLNSQVSVVAGGLVGSWTDSAGKVVSVPVTVAPYYQGVGAACLYWPVFFHVTGLRVQSDGSPELDPSVFGYPYWARNG